QWNSGTQQDPSTHSCDDDPDSGSLSDLDLPDKDFCFSLLQSTDNSRCPSLKDSAIQRSMGEGMPSDLPRGSGLGTTIHQYIALAGGGDGTYRVIVGADTATHKAVLGMMQPLLMTLPMNPGARAALVSMGKVVPDPLQVTTMCLSHTLPLPAKCRSVTPLVIPHLQPPRHCAESAGIVEYVRSYPLSLIGIELSERSGWHFSMSAEKETGAEGPFNTIELQSHEGESITIALPEYADRVFHFDQTNTRLVGVRFLHSPLVPQEISVPNTLHPIPAHPELFRAALAEDGGGARGKEATKRLGAVVPRAKGIVSRDTLIGDLPVAMRYYAPSLCAKWKGKTADKPSMAQVQRVLRGVPDTCLPHCMLEVESILMRMFITLGARAKPAPAAFVMAHQGTSLGLVVVEPALHSLVGGVLCIRGVAMCPEWRDGYSYDLAVIDEEVNRYIPLLKAAGYTVTTINTLTQRTAGGFASLQESASTCVPHLFKGFHPLSVLPTEVHEFSFSRHFATPIALMRRPVRSSVHLDGMNTTRSQAEIEETREKYASSEILDRYCGRELNLMFPQMWSRLQTPSPMVLMWSLYNNQEVRESTLTMKGAKEKRDWEVTKK
ncbi:hypothetical protein KIPB_004552, partial [Kipferlia bialata]